MPPLESDPLPEARLLATRMSLIGRLGDWENQRQWQDFFDTYSRLIYHVARRAGLTDTEAQEVVQETVITVAKNISQYDRRAGSFKSWLLHTTRWRIADQFRKREPGRPGAPDDSRRTAAIDRLPDDAAPDFEAAWAEEWQRNLLTAALERVKKKVSARQYQIFDCAEIKHWPARRVATELRVNIAQVYLARHRVKALLKKEVAALDKG